MTFLCLTAGRPHHFVFLLTLASLAACSASSNEIDDDGAQTETGGTPGADASTTDASGGATSNPTTTGADTDSPTTTTTSTTSGTPETSTTDGSTGADDVPLDELPFGGYINVVEQDGGRYGFAEFYTTEFPAGTEPLEDDDEVPISQRVPRTEDHCFVFVDGEPLEEPEESPGVYTYYEGPGQFFADGGGETWIFEAPQEGQTRYFASDFAVGIPYPGGMLTIELPASADMVATTLEDVAPMAAGGSLEFSFARTEPAGPWTLEWTPESTTEGILRTMQANMMLVADSAQFLCVCELVDDGTWEAPDECMPPPNTDPAEWDGLLVLPSYKRRLDAEVSGRRMRIESSAETSVLVPLPISPI